MLFAVFLANFIGVFFVMLLTRKTGNPLLDSVFRNSAMGFIDVIFTPFTFLFVTVMTWRYERPIRAYLTAKYNSAPISPDLAIKARRKVLNEPFVLITLSFSMWLVSAILYPVMFWFVNAGTLAIQRIIINSLSIGFTTVAVAFFLLEYVSQKKLAPHFFPNGGLCAIPKTLRIRIRMRLAVLLFACNLIPLLSILHVIYRITGTASDPGIALDQLRTAIFMNAAIFIGAGLFLTYLVSRNLTLPFAEIIETLQGVRNGKFEELTGHALPLGVSEEAGYQESQRKLAPGQIILIGTDGIWESQNTAGKMFGKERFRNVIRTHAGKSAKEILQAVIDEIDEFCHPLENEDDVTLVVVKVDV